MATRFARACAVSVAATLVATCAQTHEPRRQRFVLINETSQHDFDLAFRMSLKLAEDKSGIENALVLLPSLPISKTIEQVAVERFAQLHIGARRSGRGILFLYSAKENLMKIEVSYALEGDLPDAFCHALENAAKTYMLSEVPQDFISELIITTNLRGMRSLGAIPMSQPEWFDAEFLSGGGGAVAHGYRRTIEDYQRAIWRLPDAALGAFAPSSDAAQSVRRYLTSLEAGIGDPRLPLLTEGSRIFRAVVPRNGAQLQRIHESFVAAGEYRLLFARDLGLAVPGPGGSNLPIVVRRGADGLWYVDEPKAWTYFHRFEDDTNFLVKYADNPFFAGLRALGVPNMTAAIYGNHAQTPTPPSYPFSIAAAVLAAEDAIRAAPAVAANYARLGDLYLFEMDWLSRAIDQYERASALAPDNLAYRWRLLDLYLNDSRADRMLGELKYLAEYSGSDPQTKAWYRAYRKAYDFVAE